MMPEQIPESQIQEAIRELIELAKQDIVVEGEEPSGYNDPRQLSVVLGNLYAGCSPYFQGLLMKAVAEKAEGCNLVQINCLRTPFTK